MTNVDRKITAHPTESELASFLSGTLTGPAKDTVIGHLDSCPECMARIAAAHEAVSSCSGNGAGETWWARIKKISPYLIGAIVTFALSFILPRYFVQFLVATIILGMKWIVDAKATKMLVMIYEAWKKGGDKEAGKALETFDEKRSRRP